MNQTNNITELKQQIIQYLTGREGLHQATITPAYPAANRNYPVRSPTIAVGFDGAETAPGGLGAYWGEGETAPLHGMAAELTLRFELYTPQKEGGDALHTLYEALCDHLLLRQTPYGFRKIWCGETAWDKEAAAWRLTARAALRTALLREETTTPINRIDLIRKDG